VASDSTCWRLLDALDERRLGAVAGARARAREVAWTQCAETTGRAFPRLRVAGTAGLDVLVIDLDAHVLVCHSEKEQTGPTFKHTFGYHPVRREALCSWPGRCCGVSCSTGSAPIAGTSPAR
jgi:hypothetical protein